MIAHCNPIARSGKVSALIYRSPGSEHCSDLPAGSTQSAADGPVDMGRIKPKFQSLLHIRLWHAVVRAPATDFSIKLLFINRTWFII